MRVVGQSTAPTVQIVIYQIIIRFQALPFLLSQVQLFSIRAITSDCVYLILKFYSLVSQVTSFIHLLKIYKLM